MFLFLLNSLAPAELAKWSSCGAIVNRFLQLIRLRKSIKNDNQFDFTMLYFIFICAWKSLKSVTRFY